MMPVHLHLAIAKTRHEELHDGLHLPKDTLQGGHMALSCHAGSALLRQLL